MLSFGITEKRRIAMGANLYIMFEHHLSHQFAGADKLVVSTMAALHHCLKFHRNAFSRHHLSRMTETMSIYSAPELNSILDTTITQVLWPYIRIVRGGMHQYRFFTWIEQEIRFIARSNDLESASYTFSLDSINEIKAHYRKTLEGISSTYALTKEFAKEKGPSLFAEINIVLGDIHFLERSYDEAVVYYQTAVNAHHDLPVEKSEDYHLECLLRYVEALLKLGNVQEYRKRYDRAAMNYLKAAELVETFWRRRTANKSARTMAEFMAKSDPKFGLFSQPYWAVQFLFLKRGCDEDIGIIKPPLYLKTDPQFYFRKGQLYFYMHKHDEASEAFLKVIELGSNNKEIQSYLLPTTCINLAENFLIKNMRDINFNDINSWEYIRLRLAQRCELLLAPMVYKKPSVSTDQFNPRLPINDMSDVLSLIFYAANQYKRHMLYDHAAMAYLKAISLWILMFDMLPLYHLTGCCTTLIKKSIKEKILDGDKLPQWFDDACKQALEMIMASNGHAQQQSREKWRLHDLNHEGEQFNPDSMGFIKTGRIDDPTKRKTLKDDIAFWQCTYLGQQLIFMRNWAFVAKRVLCYDPNQETDDLASPLHPYRMPVHTARALIFSSWANGREFLRLERFMRLDLEKITNFRLFFPFLSYPNHFTHGLLNEKCIWEGKKFKAKRLAENYKKHIKHNSNDENNPNPEEYYYIIAAKGINSIYTALHHNRILAENNQAIIYPPPGFSLLNLWRMLYRLVNYKLETEPLIFKNKKVCKDYDDARIDIRIELAKYISEDIPSSYLDLDYVAADAIRQLRALSTLGDVRAISRMNIIQNNYYLNDDYEDPGFHLDWTLAQMLIPSALMSIKWIENDMDELKKRYNRE